MPVLARQTETAGKGSKQDSNFTLGSNQQPCCNASQLCAAVLDQEKAEPNHKHRTMKAATLNLVTRVKLLPKS